MSSVLQRKVLVLNKSWVAVDIATVRRAINLLCKDCALIVDPTKDLQTFTWDTWRQLRPVDGEDSIKTTSIILRVPEVIVLNDYDKLPYERLNFSRRSLYKRDANTCQYCGAQPGTEELSVDHIIPKSMGGRTTWENCVLSCVRCNARKANRTPEQAGMKLRSKPIKPKFSLFKGDIRVKSWEHFLGIAYWLVPLQD